MLRKSTRDEYFDYKSNFNKQLSSIKTKRTEPCEKLGWVGKFWNYGFHLIWCDDFGNMQEYLQGNPLWLQYIRTPLVTLGYETNYDVFVKAHGGGLSGQAQAISLGIARALLKISENHRAPLRKEGLLTRDSRVVERKKVGLKKARKAPQYSKR